MEENVQDIPQEDLDFLNSVMEEQHKEIPENSKTLLLEKNTSRFSSAIWYEAVKNKRVILAGLGGIGSWVALLLARMKISGLILYDFDNVEEVNKKLKEKGLYVIPLKVGIRLTLSSITLDEVKRIQEEGRAKRAEAQLELRRMETELNQKLTGIVDELNKN